MINEKKSSKESFDIENIKKIVFDSLPIYYRIPSISDKIIYLCNLLKTITSADEAFLVEYESKHYFSFFETKSYHRIMRFFTNWTSSLRNMQNIFLNKENTKLLSDYIFLKRNNLDNFFVVPILYENDLIGAIALENISHDFNVDNQSIHIIREMVNEQFERFIDTNSFNTVRKQSKDFLQAAKIKVMLNPDLTIIEADNYFYEILETNKMDFFKSTKGNLYSIFDHIDVQAIINNQKVQSKFHSIQKIRHQDGSKSYFYVCIIPTDEIRNKYPVATVICQNITNIKNSCDCVIAEAVLKKSIASVNRPGHFIFSKKKKTRILYASQNALDILNIDENYIYKQGTLVDLIDEKDSRIITKIINKNNVNMTECQFGLKNSRGLIYCVVSRIVVIDNEIYFATILDMSGLKIDFNEAKAYKHMPGFVAKFVMTNKLKLLEASDGFFDFLGIDNESCNKFLFPPVFKKDVRLVNTHLKKMKTGKPLSFDFRAKNKDGKVCWFHLEANCIGVMDINPVYLALFIDVTKQRQLELDLEEKRARFELIDENEKDILFEYDIMNDLYYGPEYFITSNEESNNGCIEKYLNKLVAKNETIKGDLRKWMNLLCGIYYEPFEVKGNFFKDNKIQFVHIIIEATIIYDGKTAIKVLGKIIDKNKENHVHEMPEDRIDGLTNLYNRSYGEKLIKDYLNTHHTQSYLLVADIDDFKSINFTYGYMFGNVILNEFAEMIKQLMPKDAIIYRLIEDDIVIFLKCSCIEDAKRYADAICDGIKAIYMGDDENTKLSCSVGIAGLKYEGDFENSLRQANEMVYQIKNCGRGFSAFYSHNSEIGLPNIQNSRFLGTKIPNSYLNNENDILFFAYELLEKTKNIRNAINLLLHRAGKQFGLRSISIISTRIIEDEFSLNYWWDSDSSYTHVLELLDLYKPEIMNCCLSSFGEIIQIDYKNFSQGVIVCTSQNHKEDLVIYELCKKNIYRSIEETDLILELSKIILAHIKKVRIQSNSEERSRFLSKMSHEIRTPLNIIIGMANMTRNKRGDDEAVDKYLRNIDNSAKYLLSLVNNLLDISKIESGKVILCEDYLEMDKFIENLVNIIDIQASEKNINFQYIVDVDHKELHGDIVRLNQVLINILGNAIKFTPEYGFVTLSVTEVSNNDTTANIRFSVIDTGIGIRQDKLNKIFDPFEQANEDTSSKYGGTGLGLSISSSIINMMGGAISVNSEVNKGSEFYFTIPLTIYNGREIVHEKKQDSNNIMGKRILVAEDNQLNAEIVKSLLEEVGATIETSSDGLEVIAAFSSNPINYYDVILMDVSMPIMDGLDATAEIRKLDRSDAKDVLIIAMTANTFEEDIKLCLAAGMNGHISKPFDLEKLYTQLNLIFERS